MKKKILIGSLALVSAFATISVLVGNPKKAMALAANNYCYKSNPNKHCGEKMCYISCAQHTVHSN